MRKLSNNSLWAVLLLSFACLFGGNVAQAQIPVTNAEGTKHNLKYFLNQVKEGKFTLDATTQITKATTAIGDQTKGLSEFVKKSKEKIEKVKAQYEKYKEKVEKYKAEYEKYREQVEELKKQAEDAVAETKKTVNQVKDGINTAKDMVNSAGDIVSSAGDIAKGQLGNLASQAGVDSSVISGVLGGNSKSGSNSDSSTVTNYVADSSNSSITSSSGSSITSSGGYSSTGSTVSPTYSTYPSSSSSSSGSSSSAASSGYSSSVAEPTVAGGNARVTDNNTYDNVSTGSSVYTNTYDNVSDGVYNSDNSVVDQYTTPVSSRQAFSYAASSSASSSSSAAISTSSVAEPVTEAATVFTAKSDALSTAAAGSSSLIPSQPEISLNDLPIQTQVKDKDKDYNGTLLNTTDMQTVKTPVTRRIKPVRRSFKPINSDLRSEVNPLQSFAQARYSEPLAFAMAQFEDNGTDSNGQVIVPPTVNMPCGLNSSTALENGKMDECLIKLNDAAKRPQADQVESTQAYYTQGKKEFIAAYLAEAYKAQKETEDFTKKVLSPIELAVAPTELDIHSNIVEANKAIAMAINGILKIKSSQLALDIYDNYGVYRFSSPEEEE